MDTLATVLSAPESVTLQCFTEDTLGSFTGDTLGSDLESVTGVTLESVNESVRHKTFVRVRSLHR